LLFVKYNSKKEDNLGLQAMFIRRMNRRENTKRKKETDVFGHVKFIFLSIFLDKLIMKRGITIYP